MLKRCVCIPCDDAISQTSAAPVQKCRAVVYADDCQRFQHRCNLPGPRCTCCICLRTRFSGTHIQAAESEHGIAHQEDETGVILTWAVLSKPKVYHPNIRNFKPSGSGLAQKSNLISACNISNFLLATLCAIPSASV